MSEPSRNDDDDWKQRIEKRLDKIAEAMSQLVRIEERQSVQSRAMERIGNRVDEHDARLRQLEVRTGVIDGKSSWSDKMLWAVISGFVGLAFGMILWSLRG